MQSFPTYCELDLEVIKTITAYTPDQLTLSSSLIPGQNCIPSSAVTLNEDGMNIKFDFLSGNYTHQSATSVGGMKIKNIISWISTPRLHILTSIQEQVSSLHLNTYSFIVETLNGFKYIIHSTEDTYKYESEQDSAGAFKSKITIESLEGAIMILDN